jgi:hypothetical protein
MQKTESHITARSLVLFLLGAVLLVAFLTPQARAANTRTFLETFGSVDQPTFTKALDLVVDGSNGDLLVYDGGAGEIRRFKPNGEPDPFSALGTNTITGLETYSNSGERSFAVDESGTATQGNIYVAQFGSHSVRIFSSSGEAIGQITGADGDPFTSVEFGPCGVAVDLSGGVYVGLVVKGQPLNEGRVDKFDPSANPPVDGDYVAGESFSGDFWPCNLSLGRGSTAGALFSDYISPAFKLDLASGETAYEFDENEGRDVAVDPGSGNVLVAGRVGAGHITEYDASGSEPVQLLRFSAASEAIAVDGLTGKVFAAEGNHVGVYSDVVPLPDVETEKAEPLANTELRLKGSVTPVGVAVEECFFEYGLTSAYGAIAPCEDPSAGELGSGTEPIAVHADVSGLSSETLFHYRLVAKNENGVERGADRQAKTPSKPAIASAWASQVDTTTATVEAKINPENSPTSYVVQWGETASYGNETTSQPVGGDDELHLVTADLEGLSPGTTYHYRFVAVNALGTAEGSDATLITYRTSEPPETDCPNQSFRFDAAGALPDCRAYEMVSPVDKASGDIFTVENASSFPATLNQASLDGEAITYSSYRAFAEPKSAPLGSQYLARRGPSGWSTDSLSVVRGLPQFVGDFVTDLPFTAFTPDLCQTWLNQEAPPNLTSSAIPDFPNLYRRDNCNGGYEALTTGDRPANAPAIFDRSAFPELQGYTADGSIAVFRTPYKFTDDAAEGPYQTYEVSENGIRFVCVFPLGTPAATEEDFPNCSTGTGIGEGKAISTYFNRATSVRNALSADGSRIYWTASEASSGPGKIYLRVDGSETVKVSEAGGTGKTTLAARFLGASTDGTRALYSPAGGAKAGDLDLYSAETETSTRIAGKTSGLVAYSDDLSRVYFVSEEELGGGLSGELNLILYEDGVYTAIAVLAPEDVRNGIEIYSDTNSNPTYHVAQATPDGNYLLFISRNPLTGSDNRDRLSEEPDVEIYRFDRGAGSLVCVSCVPARSRPIGRQVTIVGGSSTIPSAALPTPSQSQFYTPRAISTDGSRAFFTAYADLIPADRNGKADVYEWEAPTTGSCSEAKASYSSENAGCLYLISTGEDDENSELVDSSTSGRDVFFTTEESLLPQDPGEIDIYDARAEGGFPRVESPPAPCEGEACQVPPVPPTEPMPSSGRAVPGNVKPARKTRCSKGRRKGKVRCVKHKEHKRHVRHRRQKSHSKGGAK